MTGEDDLRLLKWGKVVRFAAIAVRWRVTPEACQRCYASGDRRQGATVSTPSRARSLDLQTGFQVFIR